LIGSRYWASTEALVGNSFQEAAIKATGDDTMRTKVPDVARKLNWPAEFDIRVLKNTLMLEYHHQLDQLDEVELEQIARRYVAAATNGDVDEGGVIVGEVTGIIRELPGARDLTAKIGRQAERALSAAPQFVC
jgi:nitronate monooxygenase